MYVIVLHISVYFIAQTQLTRQTNKVYCGEYAKLSVLFGINTTIIDTN